MYEGVGTVDHFVSISEDRSQAYEWANYRYCSGWINSSKRNEPSWKMLDPFDVQNGWFELHLPSMQLRVTDAVPDQVRERAEYVLDRLHLSNDERLVRQRRTWLEMYQHEEISLAGLESMAPLVARAIRRDSVKAMPQKDKPG